jgi:hypothetical protein
MFKVGASNMIVSITDKVLRPLQKDKTLTKWHTEDNSIEKVGIYIPISFFVHGYPDSNGISKRDVQATANTAFIMAGQTNVFYANDWFNKNKKSISLQEPFTAEEFENTSNHDSCWRSDGIDSPITRLYFDMCEWVNQELMEMDEPRKAPKDLDSYTRFAFYPESLWKIVKIRFVDDEKNPYHKKLIEIKDGE